MAPPLSAARLTHIHVHTLSSLTKYACLCCPSSQYRLFFEDWYTDMGKFIDRTDLKQQKTEDR